MLRYLESCIESGCCQKFQDGIAPLHQKNMLATAMLCFLRPSYSSVFLRLPQRANARLQPFLARLVSPGEPLNVGIHVQQGSYFRHRNNSFPLFCDQYHRMINHSKFWLTPLFLSLQRQGRSLLAGFISFSQTSVNQHFAHLSLLYNTN